MAQWLKALGSLAENLSSVLSAYMGWLTTITPALEEPAFLASMGTVQRKLQLPLSHGTKKGDFCI